MSEKIMITGIHGLLDSGEIALMVGAVTCLKNTFPDAKFYMGSTNGDVDEEQLRRIFPDIYKDIKLIKGLSSPKISWLVRASSLLPLYIPTYIRCNIGLHIGADGYSDIAWHNILSLASPITHSYQLILGRLFRKPTIACAMSIGPFNSEASRKMARFALNKTTLITVREGITKKYLEDLGIAKPIHLVGDLAFLMEPCYEGVDALLERGGISCGKLACIAPSEVIPNRLSGPESGSAKREAYVKTLSNTADYLAEKGFGVLLLCQTTGDRHDDREIAKQIQAKAKNRTAIFDNRICTPQQIKAIMSRCEIMVSSKLHSSIASTSVGTPTITLAYHPKIYGIIGEMLGQEDFIIDLRETNPSELQQKLFSKIDECLESRTRVRDELQKRVPSIRKMSLENIQLIAKLVNPEKTG